MFHKFKPRGLSQSGIITTIAVLQNYAHSIMAIIIPLYLYAIFQSELIIGQLTTIAGITGIIASLMLSWLFIKVPRKILFNATGIIAIAGTLSLFLIHDFIDATITRLLLRVAPIVLLSLLSLYLRDLSAPEKLAKNQGLFQAFVNIAWVTGPILTSIIMYFIEANILWIQNVSFFQFMNPLYIQYYIPIIITALLHVISILVFLYAKIVIKHEHLQEKNHSKKSENIHHLKHFNNISEFFQNKYRALAFINISFLTTWWVFLYIFFPLMLKNSGVSASNIALIIGLTALPLAILEFFLPQFIKFFKGSIPALVAGYTFFAFFIIASFTQGLENIPLFVLFIILSHIGLSLADPLQEYMYFEGTNKRNEEKYYSIHKMGGSIVNLIFPIFLGFLISIFGLETIFFLFPYFFIPLFILIFIFKNKKEPTK
jgi:MFS family permease